MISKKILSTLENNKNYYINQLIKSDQVDYDINPKYLKIIYGIMKLEFYMDIQKIRRVNPPYPPKVIMKKYKNLSIYIYIEK